MSKSKLDIDDETEKQTRLGVAENTTKTQIDPSLTNLILEQIDGIDREEKQEVVIRALLAFTWTQRLYFIIRSALMGFMSAVITAAIVFAVGKVDAIQVAVIGIVSFIATLVITRTFDPHITRSSKFILFTLSHHKRLRGVILSHF